MAREENTADGFPDKSEFIPPAKIRKKPDCDRKTLIPDPCDLRVDRRKKTEENNDCNTEPVVQVCPEDLGKFRIPELPVIPPIFVAKRFEPLIVPRLPDPPAPDSFCNDPITEACPSDGWLDADWAEENINTNVVIERDEFGGVKNVEDLQINVEAMPDDPKIFIPVDPEGKEFGGSVTVDECSFVATTKEEANKKAKIYAIESLSCEFCSPEVKVDCEDLQSLALPIGGVGYTATNTNFIVTGDGVGASLSPQINEHGTIVGITIDDAGEGYTTIAIAVEGDGEGAVVGRVLLDNEDGCGGAILEVEMGQTLPDPGYDPEVDPPIKSKTNVCVPPCAFSSTISQEDANDQARTAALAALDCYYQSKELNKPCTPPTIPKDGYDLPLGAFTSRIDRGTQASVDTQAKQILDALECIEVTCPDGFPGAEVDIQIIDPNDKCNNSSGGSNPSTFGATFDEANCMYKLDGTLVMPEIPCPCGFTTTSSVSQGAGGNACDAPSWSPTTIYGFDCGYENWVATKQYRRGNVVQFDGNVYIARSDERYDTPSDPNSDWDYVSPCVSQPHKVKYNYRLYENTTWSKGDVPGSSSAWNYLGRCGTPPPRDPDDPDDPDEGCGASIDLGVIVSGGGADFDFDIETCSFDFNLELPSVQLTCESISFDTEDIDFDVSVVEADAFGAELLKKGKACVTGGGCGMSLELPDFELQLNVPCPSGFEVSSDISVTGGNVTGGPGLEITATQCESEIDMDLEDCVLTLEGEICIPDLEINLDIECPEGITVSSEFVVTATGRATASGDLTATIENCALELDGFLDIDVPNVACEDGITVTSDVSITGSGSAEVAGDISASITDCDFLLAGDIDIFVPEIPCPDGMTASSSVSLSTSGRATGGGSISASVQDCEIVLDGMFEVDVPEIPCPEGITGTGSVTVTTSGSLTGGGTFQLTHSECDIELAGSVDLHVPEIPCPDGMTASSTFTATGSGMATVSGDVSLTLASNCDFELTGDISVDVPDVECKAGITGGGSVGVSGGSITATGTGVIASSSGGGGSVDISVSNCDIEVSGAITLPDIEIEVNVPCPDGITAGGDIDISGGTISGGGAGLTVTRTGNDSSSVGITMTDCALEIDGTIMLPTYDIELNIECPEGITGSGSIGVSGGGISITGAGASANVVSSGGSTVGLTVADCDVSLSGDITLPEYVIELNIECPEGITVSGTSSIRGTGMASGSVEISVENDGNCGILLFGDGDIHVPNVECQDGISGGGSVSVTGGSFDASGDGVTGSSSGGGGSVDISVNDCSIDVSGAITLPDITVSVDNPCYQGVTTSGSATISGSGAASGTATIAIAKSGECGVALSGGGTIHVPEASCPEGITATGTSSIRGTGMAEGSVEISVENDGECGILLFGDGDIHVPDVACKDGITASGSATITGTGLAQGSSTISLSESGNCGITLSGSGTIDVPDQGWCSSVDGSGSAVISASGRASGGGTIMLTSSGCGVQLSGSADISVPEVACAEGITGGGSVSVDVTGEATGGGSIDLEVNNCDVSLTGSISIDVPAPNISCADVSGALCDGDISTMTLTVCGSGGSSSSITVLTM